MDRNPFAINFGKIPAQYISRDNLINDIIQELQSEDMQNSCFMLTGTRGSGKTVTLTAIERQLSAEDDWIVVRLNPERDMLVSLVGKLYDSGKFIAKFVDGSINLSKFGIGISLETNPPVSDIESALEIILKEIRRRNKRLLVTIDEVSNTKTMREFASAFQILIREDLPICAIMAGLYENIRDLEDERNLTFLYRAPKFEMEPLNVTLIAGRYRKMFEVSAEEAMEFGLIDKIISGKQ